LAGYILVALAITRVLRDPAPRRLLLPIGSAIVVALLVAFVPVFLTYLFVEASNRPAIAFYEAVRGSLHPASLLTAVIGDLYGALDPAVEYWGPYSLAWNPANLALSQNMSQLYVGIIPVLLLLTTGIVRGIAWAKEIRIYTLALLAMLGTRWAASRPPSKLFITLFRALTCSEGPRMPRSLLAAYWQWWAAILCTAWRREAYRRHHASAVTSSSGLSLHCSRPVSPSRIALAIAEMQ